MKTENLVNKFINNSKKIINLKNEIDFLEFVIDFNKITKKIKPKNKDLNEINKIKEKEQKLIKNIKIIISNSKELLNIENFKKILNTIINEKIYLGSNNFYKDCKLEKIDKYFQKNKISKTIIKNFYENYINLILNKKIVY